MTAPVIPDADGVRLAIRLTPRAARERIDGITGAAIKVSVMAPPVDNRANDALLRLLAREFRLPQRALSLVAGGKSRHKVVHVAGDPAVLTVRLNAAITALTTA